MSEVVEDGVYEEVGRELARVEAAPPTLFGTTDPAAVIVKAVEAAKPLAEVVRKQKLVTMIQNKEYCRVEAWTLLGSMLGVFPVCVWTRKLEDGWEARVEARTRDGAIVGAAEAECLRSENQWKSRDDYALRSMAQTRATSKALRQPLGFVMQLAGFEATPAEEMPADLPAATEPPVDADGAIDWANVTVHFGTNTGKRVGDLTARSREWYASDGWAEKKHDVTDRDRLLRRACRVLSGMSTAEADGPFANDDGVPFQMISTAPNTIPVTVARCPVHHQLVGFDGEGNLIGRCSSCATEAAQAIVDIEQGVAKANQWATETLDAIGRRRK